MPIEPQTAIMLASMLANVLKKKEGGGAGQEPVLTGGPPVTNPLPPPTLGQEPEGDMPLQMMLMQLMQQRGGP